MRQVLTQIERCKCICLHVCEYREFEKKVQLGNISKLISGGISFGNADCSRQTLVYDVFSL